MLASISRCRWSRLLVLGALGAAASVAFAASEQSVNFDVLDGNPSHVVVQCQLLDFKQAAVEIDGQMWYEIKLPGEASLLVAGAPDVAHAARSVLIPHQGEMQVQVLDSRYYEIPNISIAPSKGNLLRTVDPATVPYEFGPEYQKDAFYPGHLAVGRDAHILREHRGMVVDFFPFQYNPVTRTLRVYTSLTVEVTPTGADGVNEIARAELKPSLFFREMYAAHFLNYNPDLDYPVLDETGEMLIICYDAFIPNMAPFVAHKNAIGIPTTIVGINTVGNSGTAIKAYVQNFYNTHDLAFLLLVGDAAQIVSADDPAYAKLAGGDNYPDILVGRFSAETAAQVDLQVAKSVRFEQEQWVLQPWFKKGVGVASSEGAGIGDEGQADYVHIDEIRTWLMTNGGYTMVNQIYATNGGTAAQISAAVNEGRGVINYCGHGDVTYWVTTGFSNTHVNALTNTNKLPFIVSVACVNGAFSGTTCFAEAWLRANQGGVPTGAVAMYASTINMSWAPPMEGQDEFNLLLSTRKPNNYHSYGTLCFAGSCSMMDQYGSQGVTEFNKWHVFGDPSLRVVGTTQPPSGLGVGPGSAFNAEGQQGGPFTPASMDFTLHNYDPTPINYAVTKTANWLTITNGVGTIPAGGDVTVTVSISAAANQLPNGQYADTITFTNTTNHNGDTTRAASLKVGVPTAQYTWNFDTNPGWTISGGQWAFGRPTGLGGDHGGPDPTAGYTGQNVYGYNLNGGYANNMAEYHLTTTAIDCRNRTDVSLRYRRWLGVEQPSYDHAYVRVSTNGSTWNTVWQNSGTIDDRSWQTENIDISQYADNQATVYLRWTMGTTDTSWTYCGWNIDDVELWALYSNPLRPGDLNCDGVVTFDDINPFVLGLTDPNSYQQQFPGCNILNGDCNGDGQYNFDDINPFVALLQ